MNGRFPSNDIISLLRVNRRFNLAESTPLDLTLGEVMDYADLRAMRHLKLGYADSGLTDELSTEIAAISGVPKEGIVITHGASMALFITALELCGPDHEAVLVTPCFPPTRDALRGLGVAIREAQLSFDAGYRFDLSAVASLLNPQTRLVSVASPMNPSGIRVANKTIKQLLGIMAEKAPSAMLFVDETFRDSTYTEHITKSFASVSERVITTSSCSKALGAPGIRLGWLTIGDPELRERIEIAKMNTVISESLVSQALALGLLKNRNSILAKKREMLGSALGLLERWHKSNVKFVDWVKPDAGAICCFRLRSNVDSASFWNRLPAHELQLAPGLWFGESNRVFRLGFGYLELEEFKLSLEALGEALRLSRR